MRQRSIVLFFAIIALIVLAGVLSYRTVIKNINLGLDLQGGLYALLEAKDTPQAKVTSDAMDQAVARLRNRVDKFGVSEPLIQRQVNKNRIVLQLAGVKDPETVVNTVLKTAFLEFKDENGKAVITGADLKKATPTQNQQGQPAIALKFSPEGTKKFADYTLKNVRKPFSIYLDGQLIQSPVIQEPILNGEAQISPMKDMDEAKKVSDLLNSGALPVKMDIIQKRTVGPTLGKDSLDASKKAGLIGIAAILVFMAVYYRVPGLIADFALIVYTFLLLALMAGFHATLTLPGIAGFLLSIGVAVDANVIIFERLKEELRAGKTLRSAIDAGFNRAFVTILDSNMVTIIAAIALFYFGTGPVQGFAVTLLLGIVASIVTAVFLTRYLMRLLADSKLITNHKFYGA